MSGYLGLRTLPQLIYISAAEPACRRRNIIALFTLDLADSNLTDAHSVIYDLHRLPKEE